MPSFVPWIKNVGAMMKAHPASFAVRPWTQEAADAARTIVKDRSTTGHVLAAVRGVAMAPLNMIGAVMSAPVRSTKALWGMKLGGYRVGRAGILAAGVPAAALAGHSIMQNASGREPGEKDLAPELAQAVQQQNALLQQQASTQQMLGDLQTSLVASAPRPAQEMPTAQTVAVNDNPTTRLSAGNMAELQGLAASQGAQMARA